MPLSRAKHSAALVRGELMRYLAQIAWAPHAILHDHDLRWHVFDAETLSVSAGADDTACEVFLSLDGKERITRTFAADRPRNAVEPFLPTSWREHFSKYHSHDRICLSSAGEVAWEIDGNESLTRKVGLIIGRIPSRHPVRDC
jgi:hypothetical protein